MDMGRQIELEVLLWMGKQEERRRMGSSCKEEKESSSSSSIDNNNIPDDIVPDILIRLPAKSAVRFGCVSKLWSSITSRPDFIRSFNNIDQSSSTRRLCLLACLKTSQGRLFISLPQHQHQHEHEHEDDQHSYNRYHINTSTYDVGFYQPRSESIHGFVCFSDFEWIQVWNPSMRQRVTLPNPKPRARDMRCCFGYDPVEDKYKVLYLASKRRFPFIYPLVSTLGRGGPPPQAQEESWRVVQTSHIHNPIMTKCISVCINGHVYYEAGVLSKNVDDDDDDDDDDYKSEDMLMSFQVRYEKLKTIKKPNDTTLGDLKVNYQGKLAWLCNCYIPSSCLRFWVLEDQEKQEWSVRNFILPFQHFPGRVYYSIIGACRLELTGVTHDTSEFIFVAACFEAFYVLYYDPNTKHERRTVYQGIGDIDFCIRYGITCHTIIDWFPNHTETLVSLPNLPTSIDSQLLLLDNHEF